MLENITLGMCIREDSDPVHLCTLNRMFTLRKHTYSNILKNSPPKTDKFSDKNSDTFHISAQNIDCGYLLELPC